jgi:hypothetical protein
MLTLMKLCSMTEASSHQIIFLHNSLFRSNEETPVKNFTVVHVFKTKSVTQEHRKFCLEGTKVTIFVLVN